MICFWGIGTCSPEDGGIITVSGRFVDATLSGHIPAERKQKGRPLGHPLRTENRLLRTATPLPVARRLSTALFPDLASVPAARHRPTCRAMHEPAVPVLPPAA